jgi:hypothetical protein
MVSKSACNSERFILIFNVVDTKFSGKINTFLKTITPNLQETAQNLEKRIVCTFIHVNLKIISENRIIAVPLYRSCGTFYIERGCNSRTEI